MRTPEAAAAAADPDPDWYSTSMHLAFVLGAWILTLALLW